MNSNDNLFIPQSLEKLASIEDLQKLPEQNPQNFELKNKHIETDDLTKQPIQQISMSEKGFTFNHKNRFVTNPELKQIPQQQDKIFQYIASISQDNLEEKKLDYNEQNIKKQNQFKQQKHFDEELNMGQEEEQHDHILDSQTKSSKNKRLDCSRKYFPKDQPENTQQHTLQQENDSLNNAFFEQDEAIIMDDDQEESNDVNDELGEFQLLADAQLKQELDTEKFYEKQEKVAHNQTSFLKSRFRAAMKQDQLYTDQVIKQCRFNNLNNEEENDFEHLYEALNTNHHD